MPETQFILCPACNMLMDESATGLVDISQPCPECGDSGSYRQIWPSLFAVRWSQLVSGEAPQTDEDRYVQAVIVCAFAERMLVELIRAILRAQRVRDEHALIMLESHDGPRRMLELVKKLSGVSFQQACQDAGHRKFCAAWKQLRDVRNGFVHGIPPMPGLKLIPEDADLARLREDMLAVFRAVHNRILGKKPSD